MKYRLIYGITLVISFLGSGLLNALPTADFEQRFQQGYATSYDGDNLGSFQQPFLNDYSISFWIKPYGESLSSAETIISQGNLYSSNTGWSFLIENGSLGFRVRSYDGDKASAVGNISFSKSSWTHVVGVIKRSGSNDRVHLYIDGVEVVGEGGFGALNATLSDTASITSGANPLRIGYQYSSDLNEVVNNYNGYIDDLKVWYTNSLSSTDVQQLYASGVPNFRETPVFQASENECYRIPHLAKHPVTEDLWAVAEKRMGYAHTVTTETNGAGNEKICSDFGAHDIVMRRAEDGQGLYFGWEKTLASHTEHLSDINEERGNLGLSPVPWVSISGGALVNDSLDRMWILYNVLVPMLKDQVTYGDIQTEEQLTCVGLPNDYPENYSSGHQSTYLAQSELHCLNYSNASQNSSVYWESANKPYIWKNYSYAVRLSNYGNIQKTVRLENIEAALEDEIAWLLGPGNGILKDIPFLDSNSNLIDNRMFVPGYHCDGPGTCKGFVIYSDDYGNNWSVGGSTQNESSNDGFSSESSIVELSNGDLMLTSRRSGAHQKLDSNTGEHRRVKKAFSQDGGASWSTSIQDTGLVSPIVHSATSSIYALDNTDYILFVNPACVASNDTVSPSGSTITPNRFRRNLTIRMSDNDGVSWPYARTIRIGSSGYSSVIGRNRSRIGVLYEAPMGQARPIDWVSGDLKAIEPDSTDTNSESGWWQNGITYADFSIDWVKENGFDMDCDSTTSDFPTFSNF